MPFSVSAGTPAIGVQFAPSQAMAYPAAPPTAKAEEAPAPHKPRIAEAVPGVAAPVQLPPAHRQMVPLPATKRSPGAAPHSRATLVGPCTRVHVPWLKRATPPADPL